MSEARTSYNEQDLIRFYQIIHHYSKVNPNQTICKTLMPLYLELVENIENDFSKTTINFFKTRLETIKTIIKSSGGDLNPLFSIVEDIAGGKDEFKQSISHQTYDTLLKVNTSEDKIGINIKLNAINQQANEQYNKKIDKLIDPSKETTHGFNHSRETLLTSRIAQLSSALKEQRFGSLENLVKDIISTVNKMIHERTVIPYDQLNKIPPELKLYGREIIALGLSKKNIEDAVYCFIALNTLALQLRFWQYEPIQNTELVIESSFTLADICFKDKDIGEAMGNLEISIHLMNKLISESELNPILFQHLTGYLTNSQFILAKSYLKSNGNDENNKESIELLCSFLELCRAAKELIPHTSITDTEIYNFNKNSIELAIMLADYYKKDSFISGNPEFLLPIARSIGAKNMPDHMNPLSQHIYQHLYCFYQHTYHCEKLGQAHPSVLITYLENIIQFGSFLSAASTELQEHVKNLVKLLSQTIKLVASGDAKIYIDKALKLFNKYSHYLKTQEYVTIEDDLKKQQQLLQQNDFFPKRPKETEENDEEHLPKKRYR